MQEYRTITIDDKDYKNYVKGRRRALIRETEENFEVGEIIILKSRMLEEESYYQVTESNPLRNESLSGFSLVSVNKILQPI